MKDQQPSPDFDSGSYERPNQSWICGKASQGQPCRIGPDRKGRCRATFECQPKIEIKAGETKGHFRCTRSSEQGGPCASGPRPDGTCGRPITKCVPVRSLRAKRGIFTACIAALTVGVLLIGLAGPFRPEFINPGKLSSQHGSRAFARQAGVNAVNGAGCEVCHGAARASLSGLVASARKSSPGPFEVQALAARAPQGMTFIDEKCLGCHPGHAFHQPNVVRGTSCSACHREHRGPGPMPQPDDNNCLACHGSSEVMLSSFEAGLRLPPEAFDYRLERGRVLFKAPRPKGGYTKIIHSFASDHPEFQVRAQQLEDPNTLKFNHRLHLQSTSVLLPDQRKLRCEDCHKPDATGAFHLKITYEENCKICHALQFDARNPGLVLPHGDVQSLRDFLRTLPDQYADYGALKRGITGRRALEEFVQQQIKQLGQDFGSVEELESRICLSDGRSGPVARIGQRDALGAARFPGCAYCHQVIVSENNRPQVTRPLIPDRWLLRGRFDHAKHLKVACHQCHEAEHSRQTADILLPPKETCAKCHGPEGRVASNCAVCHSYHAVRKETLATR